MTLEQAKVIVEAAAKDGITLRTREGYVGHWSPNSETVGVIGSRAAIEQYAALSEVSLKFDHMGMEYIGY